MNPDQTPSPAASRPLRRRLGVMALIGLTGLLALNAWVAAPVAFALAREPEARGVSLLAYNSFGLHPRSVTIELLGASPSAAPMDLVRSLFVTAGALKGRSFDEVRLTRGGRLVFRMEGETFAAVGKSYARGANQAVLVGALPAKLKRPDGGQAFPDREGTLVEVVGRQMQDVAAVARAWTAGAPPAG